MKSLVLAADAQSGAVLEVKVEGRSAMACGRRPFFRGDSVCIYLITAYGGRPANVFTAAA
jgi:hypothetical protein